MNRPLEEAYRPEPLASGLLALLKRKNVTC